MIERREQFGFTLEPRKPIRIAREFLRQRLDRDISFKLSIASSIHDTHATFTKQGNDFVRTELRTNCQCHVFAEDYRTVKVSGRITAIPETDSAFPCVACYATHHSSNCFGTSAKTSV